MKKIIPFVSLLFYFSSFSQDSTKLYGILPIENGIATYTGVVQIDSLNKDQLYLQAKKWFVNTYKSAKAVIQMDDKENGLIIGKGTFVLFSLDNDTYINHTISIFVKDGRYKYVLTNFIYENNDKRFNIENIPWGYSKKMICSKIDAEVRMIIASLKEYMKKTQQEDW